MERAKFEALVLSAIDQASEPYTLDEVMAELESGESSGLIGENSIMIVKLFKHNGELTGHCWLGAGDIDELRDDLRPKAEAWAKEHNATAATIDGRRGWVRALSGQGYRETSVTVRKEL